MGRRAYLDARNRVAQTRRKFGPLIGPKDIGHDQNGRYR